MAWDSVHLFECPTRVFYGRGASATAGERLRELGVTRPLVVSDPGVATAGIVEHVADAIRQAGLDPVVYAETESNPTTANITAAATLYRERRCDG